jgi:MFS family permease
MIFSIAIGGQIADRTGKRDLVIYVGAATAVVSVLLLREVSIAVWLSLAFGLVGMASAGVIMALTGEAMAPQRRAFGMGVFFSGYFVIMTSAPPVAGWLYDKTGDPYVCLQFAAVLFTAAAAANWMFRIAKRRLRSA